MPKVQKALIISVGFLILWIGWCFLVIHAVVPKVLKMMNMSTEVLGAVLCGIPILLYAGGLIAWYRSSVKR